MFVEGGRLCHDTYVTMASPSLGWNALSNSGVQQFVERFCTHEIALLHDLTIVNRYCIGAFNGV